MAENQKLRCFRCAPLMLTITLTHFSNILLRITKNKLSLTDVHVLIKRIFYKIVIFKIWQFT